MRLGIHPVGTLPCMRRLETDRLNQFEHTINQGGLDPSGVFRVRNQDCALQRSRVPSTKVLDDFVKLLSRAEPLPFEQLDDRSDLPHVGDGQFFDRDSVFGVEFLGHVTEA